MRSWVSPPRVMSRSRTRYQPEPNPVQPIFLTTDPTGWRHARLPIRTLMHHADRTRQQTNLPRNLAGTRQLIRPQPSRQSVPLPCHISTDALLRSGGIRRKRIWRVTGKTRRFASDESRLPGWNLASPCSSVGPKGLDNCRFRQLTAPTRGPTSERISASGAGPDADTFSRQSEAVSAARPRWRAKNRAELSRSYSGTG